MLTEKEIEERRFQLDLLKTELRHSALNESYSLSLAMTVSIAVSLGVTLVSIGIQNNKLGYTLLGLLFIGGVIPILEFLKKYYTQKRLKDEVNNVLEKDLREMYEKYLPKIKTETEEETEKE
ncbi:MAG: hypothetical protein ACTSW1_07870 [Candidatus Hodarchaeales archaeon]